MTCIHVCGVDDGSGGGGVVMLVLVLVFMLVLVCGEWGEESEEWGVG